MLSGSSTDLRRLAFGKLTDDSMKYQYPNYAGIDLNSTKYQTRWIYPFLDADSFVSLYEAMKRARSASAQDDFVETHEGDDFAETHEDTSVEPLKEKMADELSNLFLKTGGSPGALSECLDGKTSSTYHISAKSVQFSQPEVDVRAQVLQAIYEARPRATDSPNPLAMAANTTFTISVHLVLSKLSSLSESVLYDMADAGLIRYITDRPEVKMIGFGSPLVFFDTAMQGRPAVTPLEAAAMCYPRGKVMEKVAEEAACRLLADGFGKFVLKMATVYSMECPLNLLSE